MDRLAAALFFVLLYFQLTALSRSMTQNWATASYHGAKLNSDDGGLFESFYRDLRDRCDRGADGRVIDASSY
jgi:hypothetical protein